MVAWWTDAYEGMFGANVCQNMSVLKEYRGLSHVGVNAAGAQIDEENPSCYAESLA